MVFQGLKHNALEEPPLAGSGLPLPSALEPPRSETAKLPSSLGKVFNKLFQQNKNKNKNRCHHKAVPCFSGAGLLTSKPKSPHSRIPALEFACHFQLRSPVPTGQATWHVPQACLQADVPRWVWCCENADAWTGTTHVVLTHQPYPLITQKPAPMMD